jgi:glycosyltransferase involved in cell wall biosynthesis
VDPKNWSRHVGLPRRPTLLVAGRIMWQKQIELAFDTLRRLRSDYGMSHLDLVVAGAGDAKSRGYQTQLHQSAPHRPGRVDLDPTDEELSRLYATCSLLLFTPPNEDWGIVPLEAMAAGLPVVAVASGGPTESIEHGRSGWLVDNNSQAMADAVHGALAMTEEQLGNHRHEAQLRADSFPWDAMVARLDDVLDEVAAGSSNRKH